jgi:hypothetical protein
MQYDDIFSRGAYDMGRTSLVEHSIDTADHRPIRHGLRRHPMAHLTMIDEQVNEMLRNDLVECDVRLRHSRRLLLDATR